MRPIIASKRRELRQYPVILERVASGDLTLTALALLRPHLTAENHEALLETARHKTKRDVEYQIACLAPKVAATALIRRVPNPQISSGVLISLDSGTEAGADPAVLSPLVGTVGSSRDTRHLARSSGPVGPRTAVAPLASDRFLLRVTLSADAHAKLRRAQNLMRHTIPNGDPGAILEKALKLLVDQLEKATTAKTTRPRRTSHEHSQHSGGSRYIPAKVRRTVWTRDEGRCAFVGPHGRCTETRGLEYHHVIPFARGGATDVSNIALRCRAHNHFESELVFGRWSPATDVPTRSGPS